MTINRRRALGLGTAAAAGAVLGAAPTAAAQTDPVDDETVIPTSAAQARRRIERVYRRESRRAGGTWSSFISVSDPDGTPVAAVADEADRVVEAQSVNKIAVAVAVLDKIDRGLLTLDQRVEVTTGIVSKDGDGIFGFDGAYPSSVTLGHAMANLLTVSDNTAVRLCGLVCPAAELNEILRAKGFTHTQVKPVANPNRFYMGFTTPRETHDLLRRLIDGTLVSAAATQYVLTLLRSMAAFTDGVRLELNSAERSRVATKAGWFSTWRNEAGIVFDTAGKPMVTYALFASGEFRGDAEANETDFSTTHPALRARVKLGRSMVDAVSRITCDSARSHQQPEYRPTNGG